jgi:hypothetical protein
VIGGPALVLGIAPAAEAAIAEYTDKAAFEAALAPGAYAVGAVGPSLIGANDLMSGNADPSFRVFNFSTGIKAFGGYFYAVDYLDNAVPVSLQVSLNGSSFVITETPASATIFYGFISDSVLTYATITRSSDFSVTAGNVIVGTTASAPAPAPGSLPLFGAAAAFGWSRRLAAGRPGF